MLYTISVPPSVIIDVTTLVPSRINDIMSRHVPKLLHWRSITFWNGQHTVVTRNELHMFDGNVFLSGCLLLPLARYSLVISIEIALIILSYIPVWTFVWRTSVFLWTLNATVWRSLLYMYIWVEKMMASIFDLFQTEHNKVMVGGKLMTCTWVLLNLLTPKILWLMHVKTYVRRHVWLKHYVPRKKKMTINFT